MPVSRSVSVAVSALNPWLAQNKPSALAGTSAPAAGDISDRVEHPEHARAAESIEKAANATSKGNATRIVGLSHNGTAAPTNVAHDLAVVRATRYAVARAVARATRYRASPRSLRSFRYGSLRCGSCTA